MAIYRGAGGAGDATGDSASEALLVRELAAEVEVDAAAAVAAKAAAEAAQAAAELAKTNAETAEANAETAEANAETAEANAEAAQAAAEAAQTAAEAAQTAAETAETNAETAETNAETAATAAASSASAASTSASNAATSATNASNSATAAATSATNASNSATAAATSATNASNSATTAATSATNAANSATAAQTAETNAETAEANAETAQAAAEAAQLAAETAETNAETAETNAAASASAAATSATNASNSASAASTSASNASTSATNAANSATAASGFADDASDSADAAAASAASINLSSIAITGGSINGTTIGASSASTGAFTSLSDSGNLTFTGTGNRITGDMSNATHANRLSFQTSTTNGGTSPFFIPNGTGTTASVVVANASDPTNSSYGQFRVNGSTSVDVISGIIGTGSFLPISFYTSGSEKMRIDTSGNVGIGTSSPGALLDVNGNLAITGSARRIIGDFSNATVANRVLFQTSTANSGTFVGAIANGTVADFTGSGFIAFSNSDATSSQSASLLTFKNLEVRLSAGSNTGTYAPLTMYTGGSERLRIDTSGNVGVGTSSPVNKFEVFGNDTRNVARANTTAGESTVEAQVSDYWSAPTYTGAALTQRGSTATGTTCGVSNANLGSLRFQNGSAGLIYTNGGSPLVFGTTSTERMRIDATGNVGIGTTSPIISGSRLSVRPAGDYDAAIVVGSNASAANWARLDFRNTNVASSAILYQDQAGTLTIRTDGAYPITFNTNGSNERMRIDSTGNLSIGATGFTNVRLLTKGTNTASDTYAFLARNSADTDLVAITNSGNLLVGQTAPSLSAKFEVNGAVAGQSTVRFPFIGSASGTAMVIDGSGYFRASSSSRRYKENITPIDVGLDMVMQMQPVKYDLKEGSVAQVGFIAEDFPESRLVNYSLIDPLDPEKGEQVESVNYNNLTAILVKAIQEQQAIINDLKARIETLESK